MTSEDQPHRFETRAIHAGQDPDPETGAVMSPIYASSTYAQEAPNEHKGYVYSRGHNPTRTDLQDNLASLEGGDYALAFSSGMGAINTVVNLLESGAHVVAGNDVYGGTHRLFTQLYEGYDLDFTFVDMTDLDAIEAAFRPETELLWLETPTNPLLSIVDIAGAADIAEEYDALCAIDNTFASPYLQNPLEHGADIVAHSLTKYVGGHSDVLGGALVTDDEDLHEELHFYQNAVGPAPSPFDCFLFLRGLKTLPVRMDRHCENAMAIAEWLDGHPQVEQVYYPGLPDHPGHDIASEQMADFGGMVSFELDASMDEGGQVLSELEVFTLAESLGGVESLIEQPAPMTHADVPREERLAAGLSDGLIRASVGIEHVDDLIADLEQAIDAVLG